MPSVPVDPYAERRDLSPLSDLMWVGVAVAVLALLAFTILGAYSSGNSTKERAADWVTDTNQGGVGDIRETHDLAMLLAAEDSPHLDRACAEMRRAVDRSLNTRKIPDVETESLWRSSLTHADRAADQCTDPGHGVAEMQAFATAMTYTEARLADIGATP